MNEIVAIVEGHTEQAFVRDQLAGHLGRYGISIWAVLPGKTGNRGGVRKWESTRNDIIRTLKQRRYCTTMFDFYGMPKDWPGREDAAQLPWGQRGPHVEGEILKDIARTVGESFNPAQFVPYVQVHEFEALLFSNTFELARLAAPDENRVNSIQGKLDAVLEKEGNPEAIDDGYESCPSRRIEGLVRGYRKRLHGPIVAGRIGLMKLRECCQHFGAWVGKLEQLEIVGATTAP
jgi:hypothetical protein